MDFIKVDDVATAELTSTNQYSRSVACCKQRLYMLHLAIIYLSVGE